MKNIGKEFLVGCMVILVVLLMVIFGWLMGVVGPFVKEVQFTLLYSFAGGVEVGSPVRVSGIKVGKVNRIEFLPLGEKRDDRATLRILVSVAEKAAPAVRRDSKFYVNMAGIIGERYIEISPGSETASILAPGSVVRGVDPPRIDQLISQGYGVFGRIQDFLEENEQVVTDFLNQMTKLLTDANKLLKGDEKRKFFTLIDNMNEITGDLKIMTKRIQNDRAQKFYDDLEELVRRAKDVDGPTLKKFFQEEGVRARIF